MSEQKPHGVINNFSISSDTTNLESLGSEVTAMKVAIGLLFQKLPDHLRTAFLTELRQLSNPWMNGLADQIEQFKI